MPTPVSFLNDESILELYDAFGVDFWLRVLANAGKVIHPLQQDIKFAERFDTATLKIHLTTTEEKRVKEVFGTLSDILDESAYKHTPFLQYASNSKEVRFTFDPSLVRFTFQPESMGALTDIAHKGSYLAALRELLEILGDEWIMKHVALALERKNFRLMEKLNDVLTSLRLLQTGECNEQKLSQATSIALGEDGATADDKIGLRVAAPALQKGLEEDAMLVAYQSSVLKIDRLRVLMETVVEFVKREEAREGML